MSNNFFNFTLPAFQNDYGSDWDDFKTVVNDNVDYLFERVWALYNLVNIDRMPLQVLEWALDLYNIDYTATDSIAVKRGKLRQFVPTYANKGLASLYIDVAKTVSGEDGEFILYYDITNWVWSDTWSRYWSGSTGSKFVVYFNPKTLDSDELDNIQLLFQHKSLSPAYYLMFLVNDSNEILRTI